MFIDKGRGGGTRRRPYNSQHDMNNDKPKYSVLIGALIIFLFLLLGSYTAGAQDTLNTRQPLTATYQMFANVRSTQLGTAANTDFFAGVKSGNVSIGVGYLRQVFNAYNRNTDFQSFSPQARIGFDDGFLYLGPAFTNYRTGNYVEAGYGIEMGLFIRH